MEDGYIVRFKPNLERVDGSIPPIDVLHLHHAVWISTAFNDPIFASGEEKTIFSIPNGYGIPVSARGETWLLNYMLHNQQPAPDNVFITYEIDFIPASSPDAAATTEVEPVWLDVGGFNGFNPVYNTERGFGSVPGECAFPKERCADFDPFGERVTGNGMPGNGVGLQRRVPEGTVVWMLGHLHPGGLRLEVDVTRSGAGERRVFNSEAVYFDPGGPVSWDMSMEVTRPDYRLRIGPNDNLVLNSIYETARASWYEGMGIVILFLARGDTSGPDPFATTVDPDNVGITHGHMAEADNHGGPSSSTSPSGTPVEAGEIKIGGYLYTPGTLGTGVLPTVPQGTPLAFVNLDAPAQIFHTVTACASPCDGPTGISYPLADGDVRFDSLQLGYGPPGVTAAANTIEYTLDTASFNPGTYTYFCRVHPFMRGAFAVA